MELAEQLDPEERHAILDRFFTILTEGVHRFEGTVNQYTGDGIMALFGAPIAHEDHAQRASYAALQLRDELRGYSDELRLERGLALATRMGLNSGEVVVGKIGDDLRMDYTAQGQVVNAAQRMEQLAESGRVYLTQQTADRVSGYFRLREIGPTRIKGLQNPLRVYELEDVGEFQGRFDVSRARGLSRFVGRQREMAQLEAALERARQGQGRQVVAIVAEAGTGKSRLVYEFSEHCRQHGLRLLTASCPPHGKNIPMGFEMAASRSHFRLQEQDDRETARNKVAGRMSRADPALVPDIPFMLDFLGLSDAGTEAIPLDPETRRRQYVRIMSALLPSAEFDVVVFEDLHWTDAASEPARVQLGRADLTSTRLKVMTFRPEYRPPEADWPECEEIRLKPLSAESTAELLRDLLGADPSVNGLEHLIQERAAGNPFFVEEIVHSLAESGQLEGARGSYRLLRAIDDVEVPDSVHAVLAARIDRVEEQAKQVLQAAAVIGLEFPAVVLEGVAGIPRQELDSALHVLAGADFVYQVAAYPEIEYAFKHPLTQAVAYATQLSEPRRQAHAAIGGLLQRRHEDKLDEKAGLIAYHWEQAGERQNGARWRARAARWLETRDVDEALQHWQKTRSLLSGEVDLSSEEAELATAACTQILNLGWRQGMDEKEAARVFAEGQQLAEGRCSVRARALLMVSFGTYRGTNHGPDESLEWIERALEFAREPEDPVLPLMLAPIHVSSLYWAGRLKEAFELTQRTVEQARALGLHENLRVAGFHVVSNVTFQAGANLFRLGRFEEGRAQLEEGLALARRHHDLDTACLVEAAERYTSRHSGIWADRGLAIALIAHDRPQEARTVLERSLATMRERRIHLSLEGELLQLLARAHMGLVQHGDAQEHARQAVAAAQRSSVPLYECDAQIALAGALLRGAALDPDRAVEIGTALDRAAELIEQMGAESRRPRLEEVRGGLAHERGDTAGRGRHLLEAQRLYSEIGATGHAQRVAKELGSS
jgi:class 3 adenylate cyclase/tetratricopeptide (TPR) repeat protein